MNTAKAFVGFLIAFLVVDGVWIGLFAKSLYHTEIAELLSDTPNAALIACFYLIYTLATLHLCVLKATSLRQVQINAAVLGAVTYGTYAITNFAMLKGWTAKLLITDLVWGVVVTTVCASVAYWAGKPKQSRALISN